MLTRWHLCRRQLFTVLVIPQLFSLMLDLVKDKDGFIVKSMLEEAFSFIKRCFFNLKENMTIFGWSWLYICWRTKSNIIYMSTCRKNEDG